ncbi:paxneb protein [Phlyctema vagabunda]|uniref:Elongator complex protein 4 n=1 Tax=Phlyctema vagabunda TaxID=108571 RepID=A0ABR4PVT4_9HELO
MSFRKRNVAVAQPGSALNPVKLDKSPVPGVRPSPLDGRPTTSTGTLSLDNLLAGHAGLALGTSLLVEEIGTTDFGGTLLRYYAAEGVLQGHHVHVLNVPEHWARELPGEAPADSKSSSTSKEKPSTDEKMKIAWRYERLGEFGAGARDRTPGQPAGTSSSTPAAPFCHDFDLTKRLILPSAAHITVIQSVRPPGVAFKDVVEPKSPFPNFLTHVSNQLAATPEATIHRVIVPAILSPASYPSYASASDMVLPFFHGLRALLRKYPTRLTAMVTLPLSMFPRSSGLTRWMELLSDGVMELAPFPAAAVATKTAPSASTKQEEPPQGMLNIHRLPVFHEKGGGGGEASGFGDDLAFNLSRRKGLVIKPYSLPPVEGDVEAQEGIDHGHGKATKADIEF